MRSVRHLDRKMPSAGMMDRAQHQHAFPSTRVMRVVDADVERLFLGSMSWARPARGKPGWPAPSATGPAVTTGAVLYHRVPRLLEALGLARGDGRYARMLKGLARVHLLILDDWGITPLTAEGRRDLMEIIDDRHDRAATIVTSQVPVELWHEHIGHPTIADAVLDRLVHGAHRIELKGESMRKLRAAKSHQA